MIRTIASKVPIVILRAALIGAMLTSPAFAEPKRPLIEQCAACHGEDGIARPTGRIFEAAYRCADPATCGSEFESPDVDSLTVICVRCGRTGTLDLDACEPLDAEVSA